jgi:predicted lysophospholipase L1 biosynthesis ABC-type transport system permease subunit
MVSHKVYRAALYLYPAAFRREFSSEMTRDFHEATHEAARAGRRRDLLALWAGIGADLARTIVVQWLRTGLPVLLLCSTAAALAAASVAANVLPRAPFDVPSTAHDRDVMTLILLTCVVLLVVAATILFTFWFSRPMFRRHRR